MNCFSYRACLLSIALSFIANVAFGQGSLSLNGEVASAGSSSSQEYGYFSDDTKYSAAGTNDYYPYGARHGNAALLAGNNRWQFGGKENQQALGYGAYDFGARFYTGLQWTTMDPLAEKYYGFSPYAYCAADPVNLVDRDGKFIDTVWDIANVLYDAGSAIYYNAQGDDASAKEAMLDLGMDVTAMLIPGVPAGLSKIKKVEKVAKTGTKALKKADDVIDAGRAGSKVVNSASLELRKASQNAITPKNPFGSRGKPDHQALISDVKKELVNKYNPKQFRIVSEHRIFDSRSSRRPDIQVIHIGDKRIEQIVEIERHPESKRNRLREDEYDRLGISHKTIPINRTP